MGSGREHGGREQLVTICLAVYYLLKIGFKFSAMSVIPSCRCEKLVDIIVFGPYSIFPGRQSCRFISMLVMTTRDK